MHGNISGLAVPQYVIDAQEREKFIIHSNQLKREGDYLIFENYEGKIYRYPDPLKTNQDNEVVS